jgi:hypothetical protein
MSYNTSMLYYKCFTIVIYNCNDSGLYYKTMIITNLALAMIINYDPRVVIYDHKVCFKLKHALRLQFMIVKLL